MRALLALILFFAQVSYALPVQIDNLHEGWVAHPIKADSPEAIFSGNSEAILNYHEANNRTVASIFIHAYAVPKNTKLSGVVEPWRKAMFPHPGPMKFDIVSERTVKVGDEWRYVVEYKAHTGTSLRSLAMLMVSGGRFHAFLFEQPEAEYIRLAPQVREMYQQLSLEAATK